MARSAFGLLVAGVVGVFVFVAGGGASEGTVVVKTDQAVYGYGCQAGSTATGPVAVPIWGACSVPECWRLIVSHSDGSTSQPCVSREEYDSTGIGEFWHGRTDR